MGRPAPFPPPPPEWKWASHVPTRRGAKYKYHKRSSDAKNAVIYTYNSLPRGGTVYHLNNDTGEWEVVLHYDQPKICCICNNPLKDNVHGGDFYSNRMTIYDYKAPPLEREACHYKCRYPDGYKSPLPPKYGQAHPTHKES